MVRDDEERLRGPRLPDREPCDDERLPRDDRLPPLADFRVPPLDVLRADDVRARRVLDARVPPDLRRERDCDPPPLLFLSRST